MQRPILLSLKRKDLFPHKLSNRFGANQQPLGGLAGSFWKEVFLHLASLAFMERESQDPSTCACGHCPGYCATAVWHGTAIKLKWKNLSTIIVSSSVLPWGTHGTLERSPCSQWSLPNQELSFRRFPSRQNCWAGDSGAAAGVLGSSQALCSRPPNLSGSPAAVGSVCWVPGPSSRHGYAVVLVFPLLPPLFSVCPLLPLPPHSPASLFPLWLP